MDLLNNPFPKHDPVNYLWNFINSLAFHTNI